ncbi:MAG: polysaccharide biosynthesis protein, partial [Methylococcaceae bacterium]|nr:polysaccharide biosynthesis protein [Methylococcaceae bacterium]
SYLLGRKYYPVDYNVKRILFYAIFGMLLYFAREPLLTSGFKSWQAATTLMLIYLFTAALFEFRGLYKLKKTA